MNAGRRQLRALHAAIIFAMLPDFRACRFYSCCMLFSLPGSALLAARLFSAMADKIARASFDAACRCRHFATLRLPIRFQRLLIRRHAFRRQPHTPPRATPPPTPLLRRQPIATYADSCFAPPFHYALQPYFRRHDSFADCLCRQAAASRYCRRERRYYARPIRFARYVRRHAAASRQATPEAA